MSGASAVHHGAFGRAALYDLDRTIITHAHREGHLVFHVDGAAARLEVDDRALICDATQAVAINPWEPHSFHLGPSGARCCCLVLYISQDWFFEMARNVDADAHVGMHFGAAPVAMTPEIAGWVARLTALLLEGRASTRFDRFLFETTRACHTQSWRGLGHGAVNGPTMRARPSDFRVRRSVRLMQENMIDELPMDGLAREVGLSRPHFFKLFKMQTGVTPNLYRNTLRTEQAIADLMTTRKSVTDIGFDLGFSSQASFTRFFASNVGIPPTEYRRVAHIA